ncbi:VOC family protein [Flavobacterium sp.]|uniref:VOC family protein n=1 Tax=Flavobacterium sp. TaxID=239 RepID=UPI0037BCBE7A
MRKTILLIIAILFTGSIWAQDTNSFSFSFDHSALSVKDVNISADFYKNVLKLEEVTNRTKKPGIRWISLGEGKELHLISTIKGNITITKAVHIALKCANFDTFVKAIIDQNIIYSDWDGTLNKITIRADGIKQIYFQDPDGYWIEVNSVAKL